VAKRRGNGASHPRFERSEMSTVDIGRRNPGSVLENQDQEQVLGPIWLQVAPKPYLGQNGIPLPGSAYYPLWIQPSRRS